MLGQAGFLGALAGRLPERAGLAGLAEGRLGGLVIGTGSGRDRHRRGEPGDLGRVGIGAGGVELGGERDQVGELGDGEQVAEPGQPLDAAGIEVIADEQPQVGVEAAEQARLAVVAEVALADELDHRRVPAGVARAARAGGDQDPDRRVAVRPSDVIGDDRPRVAKLGGEIVEGVLGAQG